MFELLQFSQVNAMHLLVERKQSDHKSVSFGYGPCTFTRMRVSVMAVKK